MGLDAKIEVSVEGNKVMVVNVHPQTSMDGVADMLEDLAASIRKDLKSKTPVLTLPQRRHEIDTNNQSLTPPAAFTGQHLENQFDTACAKLFLALDYGDDASVTKYWDRCEKLHEWMVHNYEQEAIDRGPISRPATPEQTPSTGE